MVWRKCNINMKKLYFAFNAFQKISFYIA